MEPSLCGAIRIFALMRFLRPAEYIIKFLILNNERYIILVSRNKWNVGPDYLASGVTGLDAEISFFPW